MLTQTSLVINGVWRDVLWCHHRVLYLLPLASCQFLPYLFSELMFTDSFRSHFPSQTGEEEIEAGTGGGDGWDLGLLPHGLWLGVGLPASPGS